jgi:ribose-phosphate pyrophosphokinase
VTGEVRDRTPLIIDDLVTTGGTVEAAIGIPLEAGCRPEITVAATHGLSSSVPPPSGSGCSR